MDGSRPQTERERAGPRHHKLERRSGDDRISFDTHRLSKRAKDLGSAAVLLALVLLGTTWFLVAGPAVARMLGFNGVRLL